MRIRAVVLDYDGGPMTVDSVEHLVATDWPAHDFEVVVVDNGSRDPVALTLADRFAQVRAIVSGENRGFAGGNNLALRDLEGIDAVALVNNDVTVAPGWLAPLAAALAADPGVGAACPKILFAATSERAGGDAGDVINNVGTILRPDGYGADRGWLEPDRGQYDRAEDVFAWCGAAVLLRADYLRQVGLFDERLFLYYEDLELSWRGAKQGWRYRYVPESVVRHLHSATAREGSRLARYYNERNRLLVLTRHAPARQVVAALARYVAATLSYAVRPLLSGRRPSLDVVVDRVRALAGFARRAPGMVRDRRPGSMIQGHQAE